MDVVVFYMAMLASFFAILIVLDFVGTFILSKVEKYFGFEWSNDEE